MAGVTEFFSLWPKLQDCVCAVRRLNPTVHELGEHFERVILKAGGASDLHIREIVQEMWSGYGQILRIDLDGGRQSSVIAKHVRIPTAANHPRGWNTGLSNQRKVRSYEVERHWYSIWAARCSDSCRVPYYLGGDVHGDEVLMVLEDLDAAGFNRRLRSVNESQLQSCLNWLAEFHATFVNSTPDGLWETGTYWHLDTRPDELEALDDQDLKRAAPELDRRLKTAQFQTLVHGDAKLSNFCFNANGKQAAAVDFQYVGGGCGIKDLAYFLGSCLDEDECERREEELLDCYFGYLGNSIRALGAPTDTAALIAEWRELYPIAWTDFHRFLKGWSPGHWKLNTYSERMAAKVLADL